jgi:phospholipase/carboxylesterase
MSAAPLLNGPRLPAASGGTPRHLVVFLHGYGADGNDLIAIGRQWARDLQDTAFVAPHAPEPCGMSPMGRQWFGLTFRDPNERWRGVQAARPRLDAFLDAELQRLSLPPSALALVGFSQGAMMAFHTGLRRPVPPGAIVAYSGTLEGADHLKAEATGKPPIFIAHGDQDEVIPVDAMFEATEQLAKAEIPAEFHLSVGVGHGIDPEAMRQGGAFIAAAFRRAR